MLTGRSWQSAPDPAQELVLRQGLALLVLLLLQKAGHCSAGAPVPSSEVQGNEFGRRRDGDMAAGS